MRNILIVLAAAVALAAPAAAQSDSIPLAAVPLESRVRVVALEGQRFSGRLLATDSARVLVQVHHFASPTGFSIPSLQSMQASRGRRRALWTTAGAVAGAAAGIVYTRAQPDEPGDIGGLQRTADGLGNTLIGIVVGGVAGFFLAPERWRAVSLGR